jgi:hypothetical protein
MKSQGNIQMAVKSPLGECVLWFCLKGRSPVPSLSKPPTQTLSLASPPIEYENLAAPWQKVRTVELQKNNNLRNDDLGNNDIILK